MFPLHQAKISPSNHLQRCPPAPLSHTDKLTGLGSGVLLSLLPAPVSSRVGSWESCCGCSYQAVNHYGPAPFWRHVHPTGELDLNPKECSCDGGISGSSGGGGGPSHLTTYEEGQLQNPSARRGCPPPRQSPPEMGKLFGAFLMRWDRKRGSV